VAKSRNKNIFNLDVWDDVLVFLLAKKVHLFLSWLLYKGKT